MFFSPDCKAAPPATGITGQYGRFRTGGMLPILHRGYRNVIRSGLCCEVIVMADGSSRMGPSVHLDTQVKYHFGTACKL